VILLDWGLINAEFDWLGHAIELNIAQLTQTAQTNQPKESPISLEGIPRLQAPTITLTAIDWRVNITGRERTPQNFLGNLTAVGTIFGGSFFVRLDQPNLQQRETWRLAEAQFLRKLDRSDYIFGSQAPFWRSQGMGDYWGFTVIQRWGFTPPPPSGRGGFNPQQRLQASQIERTIVGRANPGTLVRLTQGLGEEALAEVLVDSSGIYRFENVRVDNQSANTNYRVLLYRDASLTAQPEIRDVSFSRALELLPSGASALIVSGGLRRQFAANDTWVGTFSDFRGGISQRWGLTEELTVGLGGVYDRNSDPQSPSEFRGLAELFFLPGSGKLQASVSAIKGDTWDVNADIRLQPFRNFTARFNSDRFSQRFNLDWRVLPGLSLFGAIDSRDGNSAGLQFSRQGRNYETSVRATFDSNNRFRWNLRQRLGKLEFTQQGNEISTQSALSYNFSAQQSLLFNYETRSQNLLDDNLATLSWRYRSTARSLDGNYLWEAQLGYAIGSRGEGIIASAGTTIIPGLLLRGRYQGVALTSSESSFNIELVSSLDLQAGISPSDRRNENFRTLGGIAIFAFFDANNNGKQDAGESIYTGNLDMFVLDNKPLASYQVQRRRDRNSLRLPQGTYRLDFKPSGFPPGWKTTVDALAIDVVAGAYTVVRVPLVRAQPS
jgi:hypothetical protein